MTLARSLPAFAALLVIAAAPAFGFDLTRDGKPAASIVVRATDSKEMSQAVRLGLKELREHVKEITGADLPVVAAGAEVKGPVILLGPSDALARRGVSLDALKHDEWVIRSGKDFLAIAGRDVDCDPLKESILGTYNGVVAFLEDYCGARQYMPGRLGRVVTRTPTLSVADDLNAHGRKGIVFGVARFMDPATRLRWRGSPGVRLKSCGGHSWQVALPVKDFFREHPEYFALVSGKRSNHEASSLCVTNPDVLRVKVAWAQGILKDYDILEVGHPDSYGGSCPPCECEPCKAVGDTSERCYWFHRRLAEALEAWNPAKKLLVTAYGPTKHARAAWKFPRNVIVEVSALDSLESAPDGFVPWPRVHDQFSVYVYFWLAFYKEGYAPHFSQAKVLKAFAGFKKHGVSMIYYCSQPLNWGLEAPQYLLDYRLRMDLDADPKSVLDEFYGRFYGPAGEKMRGFFDLVEEAQAAAVAGTVNSESIYLARWPEERTARGLRLLDEAVAAAGDDPALRARIELSRPALQYIAETTRVFHAHRQYQRSGAMADLEALAAAAARREAAVDAILARQESGHYRDAGLPDVFYRWNRDLSLRDQLIYGAGTGLQGPFRINFQTMLGFIREHGLMKTQAPRAATPVVVDGVLDEPVWKTAQAVPVFHNEKGTPAAVPAQARIAYDDEAVYVAFDCSEPATDKMERKPYQAVKKEAPWYEDCVEVFIGDAEPGSRRYVHFIASFTNARYEGRAGFVEDELDPLYNAEDGRWQGEWRSAARVVPEEKRWFVEMAVPWKSIGFGRPKAGECLRANLCRNRWTEKERKDWADLFSWSPTFAGLQERTRFGVVELAP